MYVSNDECVEDACSGTLSKSEDVRRQGRTMWHKACMPVTHRCTFDSLHVSHVNHCLYGCGHLLLDQMKTSNEALTCFLDSRLALQDALIDVPLTVKEIPSFLDQSMFAVTRNSSCRTSTCVST